MSKSVKQIDKQPGIEGEWFPSSGYEQVEGPNIQVALNQSW